ncbi:TetR/AcrR family transcriptional regulator [Priestia taiwanensis]|uniref:TetR family transcriptional regulator n=1 Tax=Priestia taiwanensis TaxID=1347902 RepID=A0A917EM21_9BACI|nr:TetR/AcrR family transcriptional regulator [Priestia taiwanensis]MBM7361499.1 AcrR family transcriptional regulator [Priestia taiwanensis]GGE54654.1 TetR family transcriptional regulator [Priestia taiwanensis]
MNKVDETRELIIRTSLALFNKKGYSQTSIQDIMEVAGLPKGAIYRRFENKNDIAIASFERASSILWESFLDAVESKGTATDKLMALFHVYEDAVHHPPIAGGCPLLNTAVEVDFGFPELREKAAQSHEHLMHFIQSIINEGISSSEFRQDIDSNSLASFLISTIEGAIMASRVSLNNEHMQHSVKQIHTLLQYYSVKNHG